ncbi:MAG: AAA family ATPase [Candidatus Pacebacteria bacterium]|nr:AAA family ATPase [Candidatus Paceibacterota bacterium]
MTQDVALKILQTGANVFLTGEPGSGKTHTVNAYVKWLRERGIEPAITASTGIAATHVGGMTIHAWTGIGVKRHLTEYDIDEITSRERLVKRAQAAHVLIIDEISMIDSRTLGMAEQAIRALKHSQKPWGGMQIVFVGDFFQLPPVSANDRTEKAAEDTATISFDGEPTTERARPRTSFAYTSPAWTAANPIVCYLSEQHRQEDAPFLALLTAIRRGAVTDDHHNLLNTRASDLDDLPESAARLYSHNANVDRENTERLSLLSAKTQTYGMVSKGAPHIIEALKRGCLSPEQLTLKVGARVMFTKNALDGSYANGTLGEVIELKDIGPVVRTNTGRTILAQPAEWSVTDGGKVLARVAQVPLRLAWAVTVHKSQGMTLDSAAVDLSQAFEFGQGYVALSRVRELSGLYLLGYNERALQIHPEVAVQDTNFKLNSAAARKKFDTMPDRELKEFSDAFIEALGGDPRGGVSVAPKGERIDTATATLELVLKNLSLEEIAIERKLKPGTIVSHLEQLKQGEKLPTAALDGLIPDAKKKELKPIISLIKKKKITALTPIFQALKGAHSFEDIRLARLFVD